MLDSIFYHPDEIVATAGSLFMLWEGLSSFGGFVGGLIGIVLWKYFELSPNWSCPRGARVRSRSSRSAT